jgi:pyruvate formate lyase activating enzyme
MRETGNENSGLVFDIQSYSLHDGPGCRTTVFLAGCFLRCRWCANPESWDLRPKIMFARSKCQHRNGCTHCVKACARQGVSAVSGAVALDRETCRACRELACADVCHSGALKPCGRWYSAEALMHIIQRDRNFWGAAGGVTFGGGEPFYQKEFLRSVLKQCKQAFIHTAIETTAYAATNDFLAVMADIDFAFIDIKHMDSARHRQETGVGNERILHNIAALAQSNWPGRLVLRMPVIGGFNDNRENAARTADFMDQLGLYEINLLPFHRLGASKWEQLGTPYAYQGHEATATSKLDELQQIFFDRRIVCYNGSDTAF